MCILCASSEDVVFKSLALRRNPHFRHHSSVLRRDFVNNQRGGAGHTCLLEHVKHFGLGNWVDGLHAVQSRYLVNSLLHS